MTKKFFHKAVVPVAIAGVFTLVSAVQLQALPRLHQTNQSWNGTPAVTQTQHQASRGFFEEVWSFLTSLFGAVGSTIDPNG